MSSLLLDLRNDTKSLNSEVVVCSDVVGEPEIDIVARGPGCRADEVMYCWRLIESPAMTGRKTSMMQRKSELWGAMSIAGRRSHRRLRSGGGVREIALIAGRVCDVCGACLEDGSCGPPRSRELRAVLRAANGQLLHAHVGARAK